MAGMPPLGGSVSTRSRNDDGHPSRRRSHEFPCDVCGARLDAAHLEPGGNGSICSFCGAELPIAHPRAERESSAASTDLGDTLRGAREDRGDSLDHVARVTGIREPYLQALEDGGSSFEPYPGRVYGRSFRQYAQYLGLEPGPLVRAFDHDAEPAVTPESPPSLERKAPSARRWALGAAFVLMVSLVATAVTHRPTSAPTALPPAGQSISSAASGSEQSPGPPSRPVGLRAVVTVTDRCWIRAVEDGRTVVSGKTYVAGDVVHLHGKRTLDLTFGNGGGVRLELNGRRVPIGGNGDVVHLSLAWRNGHVVRL